MTTPAAHFGSNNSKNCLSDKLEDDQDKIIKKGLEQNELRRSERVRKATRFFNKLGDNALLALDADLIVPPKDYNFAVNDPKYSNQ